MKFLIHLIAESEVGQHVQEIASLERKEHRLEDVGLTLREAKMLLRAIQQRMVEQQVEEHLETQRSCPHCCRARGLKGNHTVTFQTLFGNLELCSPRWNHCGCRPNPAKTFSPLLELLDGHVSPERLYLETKWASLIPFELAAHLLKDTLPVAEAVNAAGVRNHWSLILIRYSSAFSSLASALAVLRFWVATGGSEPSPSCFWSTGVTLAGAGAATVCGCGLGRVVATEAVPGSKGVVCFGDSVAGAAAGEPSACVIASIASRMRESRSSAGGSEPDLDESSKTRRAKGRSSSGGLGGRTRPESASEEGRHAPSKHPAQR
jgi:hypothetical protein